MTLQTGKPIPAGSPAVDHGSRPAMPVVPSQGEASGADRLLTAEEHVVIARCVERQPILMMRGQHEGYYIHSDISDLLTIIGRLSAALSGQGAEG